MKAADPLRDGTRVAGNEQAVLVILIQLLPVLAIISLAPGLPGMLQTFANVPHSAFLVVAALTMPGLCIALFASTMGSLVDRFGRRAMVLIAMLAYAVLGVLPALLGNLYGILASRFGLGIAEAAIMASSTTLLSDYFEGVERARRIAIQSAVISLSAVLLYFLGGVLASINWRAPFLLYGVAIPLLVWAYRGLWEPSQAVDAAIARDDGAQLPLDRRWFALVLVVTLIGAITFYVAPIQLSIILAKRGIVDPTHAGLLGAIGTLGVPLGAIFFKRHLRWPIAGLLTLTFLTIGVGLIGMGMFVSPALIIAAMFVNQFGCGLLLSSLLHWMMSGLPPAWRGRGNGRWTSAFFLGQFASPLVVAVVGGLAGGVATSCSIIGAGAMLIGCGWGRKLLSQ